jgi:hypothetical protein
MTWFSNLIPYALATAGIILASTITSNVTGTSPAISQSRGESRFAPTTSTSFNAEPSTDTATTSPRRLTVTVKVAEPQDLKIKEGQSIKQGEIISDRATEKTRLVSQQQQLLLSLNRLKSTSISPPLAPAPVPTVNALPPVSYLENEAAVEKTKSAIASAESEIELKKQEIDYLSGVPNLDSIVLEHEQKNLAKLQLNHTAAVRDYQLAMGKMQTAKDSRKYQEYEASVTAARRVEEMNQARLNYQRQLSEFEQRLADKEFQVSQVQTKLNEVDNAIASLAQVKAPYAGTVRRIKWLGQSPDGSLTAEVTLMVSSDRDAERSKIRAAASLSE